MWDATQPQGVALGWYVMPLRGCHSAPGGAPVAHLTPYSLAFDQRQTNGDYSTW